MLSKIEQIITNQIRPNLSQHHGDVEIVSFEDGIVKVRLLGQCSGCPSAQYTVENFIESTILQNIPEVKEVYLSNDINKELYDFAKKFLNRNKVGD